MTVYRDYSQEELDRQYNARAAVPDADAHFARWAADSRAVRERVAGRYDLAYGTHPRERLDILAAGPDAPVHVFIHGGYWRAFDKESWTWMAPAWLDAGVSYVAISYPLAPEATLDAIVDSVRRALAWLWREGAGHGIARDRLFVSGHSAGGHLTAEALSTDWPALDPVLPADLVKGGFAVSGLYDLEPIRLTYLNEVLGLDTESARRNSPIAHVPRRAGPLLLSVGGAEPDEFHRQQATYAAAWRGAGLLAEEIAAPGDHHFSVVERLAQPSSPLFAALCRLAGGAVHA